MCLFPAWASSLDEAIEVLVNMPSKVRQQGGHQSFDCRVALTCPGTGTTQRVSHDDAEKHDDAFDCSIYAGCSRRTVAFLLSWPSEARSWQGERWQCIVPSFWVSSRRAQIDETETS